MTILGISGSLRKQSSNGAILAAARGLVPPGVSLEVYSDIGCLPHFNPDYDQARASPEVVTFRKKVEASNALLISTPEYAHGIPGSLKNALDWLVSDETFAGKPVGLIFASASEGGFAQNALVEVLTTMSARIVPGVLLSLPGVRMKVDEAGQLLDGRVVIDLKAALARLVEACNSSVKMENE